MPYSVYKIESSDTQTSTDLDIVADEIIAFEGEDLVGSPNMVDSVFGRVYISDSYGTTSLLNYSKSITLPNWFEKLLGFTSKTNLIRQINS